MLIATSSDAQSNSSLEAEHAANKTALWSDPERVIASEKILFAQFQEDSLKASAAQLIGVGYSLMSQWDSAITYHYLSLRFAKNAKSPKLLAFAYNNLGLVHLKLQDTAQANHYLDLAEPFVMETSSQNELARFYRSKYLALPESEEVKRESFVRKALKLNVAGKDSTGIIAGYLALIDFHADSASFYIEEAEKLLNTNVAPCDEVAINFVKAEQKLLKNKPEEAISLLLPALELSKELNSCYETESILLLLSEAYEAKKDFDNARVYLDQYYDMLSELNRTKSKAASSNKYLKLLNAELEKLMEAHNSDIKRIDEMNLQAEQDHLKLEYSRRLNLFVFCALVCLAVLSGVLVRMIQLKKRKQKELNAGIEKLQAAHEELSTSNQKLKSTQIQLIQSEKLNSLGVMVASVAHEINNPLHYLQSGIYLLRSKEPSFTNEAELEEYREVLGLMEKGVHEASSIVGNLKQFSRKSDFSSHTVINLNNTINRSLQLLEHKIARSVGSIQVSCKQSFFILANEESVVQIFVNLISNALHASPQIGSISINLAQHQENEVQVHVMDQGVGISEEDQRKIFDPFFTTKPLGEGTGLGLSIVHKLVEEQNGSIQVESKLHEGTTFTITFPLASEKN